MEAAGARSPPCAACIRPSGCSTRRTLFLHRDIAKLPEAQRQHAGRSARSPNKLLAGKQVLIVDDDMRNIFALTTVLEEHDMVIVSADNGRDAIRDPAGSSRTSTSC